MTVKILHLSDLHFNTKILDWIMLNQERSDVICLTGDLLDLSINTQLTTTQQINWIKNWINNIKKPLFICSGNHDELEQDLSASSIEDLFNLDNTTNIANDSYEWLYSLRRTNVFVDNDITKINGLTIACIPFDIENFDQFINCDILLHHVPPSKTKIAIGKYGDYGCDKLKRALKNSELKPKCVLSGHIHDPLVHHVMYKGVNLFNPGSGIIKQIPKHLFIDV